MSTYQVVAPVAVRPLWSGSVIVSVVELTPIALVRVEWKVLPGRAPAFATRVAASAVAAPTRVRASAERRRSNSFISSPLCEGIGSEAEVLRAASARSGSGFAAGGVVEAQDVVDAVEDVVEAGPAPGHRGERFVIDAAVG